jgi:thiosulfate/3-mercaptopyruvate sulfurtransferase
MLTMLTQIVIICSCFGADPNGYAKPELLIEPAALAEADALKKFVILDIRNQDAYAAGHIRGAIRVDVAALSKAFNADKNTDTWANRLAKLGVNVDTPVVVYGSAWTESARLWWILHYWGVADAKLLNGGWTAWKDDKGPVSIDQASPKPVAAKVKPITDRLATKAQMLDFLNEKSCQILDARTDSEFNGIAGGAKKKGSIPGACHLEWNQFVDAKTQKLKPAKEIASLLKECGIDLSKPVVTYCQSGGRAAVSAFVLELMGDKNVRNYYRSWAEWGNADDTPVAKPEKK